VQFSPLSARRGVDAVIETIEERILDGSLADGDLLPSEEQLAAQLGVGRRSVREALKALEMKGLLEIRMGVGTIARRNDLDSFLDTLARNMRSYLSIRRADLEHFKELRSALEGRALERLSMAPDKETLERLSTAVARQHRAWQIHDRDTYQEWHFRFHQGIVDSLHNPLISMIYRQVLASLRDAMQEAASRSEIMLQSIREHEGILAALQGGQTQEVQSLLEHHLQGFVVHLEAPPIPSPANHVDHAPGGRAG